MVRCAIYAVIARGITRSSEGGILIDAPYKTPFSLHPKSEDKWAEGGQVFVTFEHDAHAIVAVYDDERRPFQLSCAIVYPNGSEVRWLAMAADWVSREYQLPIDFNFTGQRFQVHAEGVHRFRFRADGEHLIDIPWPIVVRYDPDTMIKYA